MNDNAAITVEILVRVSAQKAWDCWTNPDHIVQWAFADDTWEAPAAENDVREGGRFKTVMRAKDGSAGFDFTGTYVRVTPGALIEFRMDDGRMCNVRFSSQDGGIRVVETFDPETENPVDFQRAGWQAFLENFKRHAEACA